MIQNAKEKIYYHSTRKVHFSITTIAIIAALVGFVDVPLLSTAQEITMQTPIIRMYRVNRVSAQEAATPSATSSSDATSTTTTTTTTTTSPTSLDAIPTNNNQPSTDSTPSTSLTSPTTLTTPTVPQTTSVEQKPAEMMQPAPTVSQPAPIMEERKEEMEMDIEFVDPREVENVIRDIKRMQGELKRFVKQLKKLPNSQDDLKLANDLLAQSHQYYLMITKTPEDMSLREALQDFWDARMWEEVDQLRAKIEIPRELKSIAKDLKKLKKLITQKSFKNLGFDMEVLAQNIGEIETAYNEAKTNYDAGDLETAWEAMELFHGGGSHPGEIMGVLYQMKEIKDRTRGVRNAEVKEIVGELLQEVIDAADSGDYREANMVLQEIRGELMKIVDQFMKKAGVLDEKTRAKLDKLEGLIQQKLEGEKKMMIEEKNE